MRLLAETHGTIKTIKPYIMRPERFLAAGAAALILTAATTSCSNDDRPDMPSGEGNVTFSVNLADTPTTRAFGDGRSATSLVCAVYDRDGNLVTRKDAVIENLTASVQLQLASGESYDIAFFAYRDGRVYSIDTATGKVSVDYSAMNDGTAASGVRIDDDCFYTLRSGYTAGSSAQENITLTRPVAQINFGTDDLGSDAVAKAYPAGAYAQISFDAYTTLNLLTGEAEGTPVNVVLPLTPVDNALLGEAFPVEGGYSYMAMGYALVPAEGSVSNLTLGAFNGASATTSTNAVAVPNAPLKRNHRTNIYGSLLSSASDWSIRVDEGWAGRFDISDFTGDESLAEGGNVRVNSAVDAITIPEELKSPLTLHINAPVGTLTIGETSQPVTIDMAGGTDYPEIRFVSGSNVRNLTIKGDPASDKAIAGFDFFTNTALSRPAMLDNLTLEGLTFREKGFMPQYTVSTLNTVIRNCRFLDMKEAAVAVQHAQGGGNQTAENLTIEGCTIEYAADVRANANGLYLLDITGTVTVKDNVIRNAAYNGVSISALLGGAATNAVVTGNTIVNARKDGVKVENLTGTVTVNGNTITAGVNGIRLKNSVKTADIEVNDNSIDMSGVTDAWVEADGEPSGILLFNSTANDGAKVTVRANTVTNCTTQPFTKRNITEAAGSDTSSPLK